MDDGDRINAITSEEQAELIAEQTARLLLDLDEIEKRLVRLEHSIRRYVN